MTAADAMAPIARYERNTGTWVAQDWDEKLRRFVDAEPAREATDEEVARISETIHPDWAPISPSRTSDNHWISFVNQGDLDDPGPLSKITFHCEAPAGADCRWSCPEDCDAFPCIHPPKPSDCWAADWVDSNYAEDVFEETSLDEHGYVSRAIVDLDWEGDYVLLRYRTTDTALAEDTKVMTR